MSSHANQGVAAMTKGMFELKPEEPDGYFRRADVYASMNKDAEAKADEKKAEELDAKARR